MDANLSKKIARIQMKLLNAIRCHEVCYEKLLNGDQSIKIRDELLQLKRQMLQCNEEQEILLQELNNQVIPESFTFNLYKIPPSATPRRSRRRKDKLLGRVGSVKNTREAVRARTPSVSSPSSDSSLSSSSSDSEDHCERMKLKTARAASNLTTMRQRPTLLPKKVLEPVKVTVPEVKPRNIIAVTVEKYYKTFKEKSSPNKEGLDAKVDLEVDPDLTKVNFMANLNLIPKEIAPEVMEIINKKTERKRRSTANNQFVYNNEWEMPVVPTARPKQYLSPTKLKAASPSYLDTVDELPASPNESDTLAQCKDCESIAVAVECTKCLRLYHPKCPKVKEQLMQSFLKCPQCFTHSSTSREIHQWGKAEKSSVYPSKEFEERDKVREHLRKLIRFRELEKTQMEKTVLRHTESIVLQKKVMDMQIRDGIELEKKIKKITSFILLFQNAGNSCSDSTQVKPEDKEAPQPSDAEKAPSPADKENNPERMQVDSTTDADIAEMDTQPVSPNSPTDTGINLTDSQNSEGDTDLEIIEIIPTSTSVS